MSWNFRSKTVDTVMEVILYTLSSFLTNPVDDLETKYKSQRDWPTYPLTVGGTSKGSSSKGLKKSRRSDDDGNS